MPDDPATSVMWKVTHQLDRVLVGSHKDPSKSFEQIAADLDDAAHEYFSQFDSESVWYVDLQRRVAAGKFRTAIGRQCDVDVVQGSFDSLAGIGFAIYQGTDSQEICYTIVLAMYYLRRGLKLHADRALKRVSSESRRNELCRDDLKLLDTYLASTKETFG